MHAQLWEYVQKRLDRGDTLVTSRQFVTAMVADYAQITGSPVDAGTRQWLEASIASYNRDNPRRYVAAGVQNSMQRAFQCSCLAHNWDSIRISVDGARVMARFKSRDTVQELLRRVNVLGSWIDDDLCVRRAIRVVSGAEPPMPKRDPSEPFATAAPRLSVVSGTGPTEKRVQARQKQSGDHVSTMFDT